MAIPTELFHGDHYDLPQQYRAEAIAHGAQPVTAREVVRRLRAAGLRVSPADRRQAKAAHATARPGDAARSCWETHIGSAGHQLHNLVSHYGAPNRHYHDLRHVDFVVRRAQWLADVLAARGKPVAQLHHVMAAALYHDVIYRAAPPAGEGVPGNEEASAQLAAQDLAELGWGSGSIDAVGAMIRGTASHLDPPDVQTAVLFDADLAVLGAPPEHYRGYLAAVRREYAHVPDDAWREGRPAVLQQYLDRPAIFATEVGRQRWETQARANVEAEIASLG